MRVLLGRLGRRVERQGGALVGGGVAVDAACGVRYAFRWSDSMDVPATFGTASIADGVLTVPCSTGRCAFARHGETLWSGYSDLHVLVNRPGGAVLERIR